MMTRRLLVSAVLLVTTYAVPSGQTTAPKTDQQAETPESRLAALSEVTRLKVENLQLRSQALDRDLQTVLQQIRYQDRLKEISTKKAEIEGEIVLALGGDPKPGDLLDWTTLAVKKKAAQHEDASGKSPPKN